MLPACLRWAGLSAETVGRRVEALVLGYVHLGEVPRGVAWIAKVLSLTSSQATAMGNITFKF